MQDTEIYYTISKEKYNEARATSNDVTVKNGNWYYFDKSNKSFARRIGRKLNKLSQQMIDKKLPQYLYDLNKFKDSLHQQKFLEIGFGMGEHFVSQLSENPDKLYIGAEVYINGVANALKSINTDNFMIWPDDVNLLLPLIPPESLSGIYLLFPDPWHKKKYLPRRLLNQERLTAMKKTLQPGGFISFASDIDDYFDLALELLLADNELVLASNDTNFQIKCNEEQGEPEAYNKLLAKPASGSKMLGDLGAQDRNVFNIHEDPSTKSTKQVAAEVGLCKKFNDVTVKDGQWYDYSQPHAGYIQTKYHTKAIKEGRSARFLTVIKK